MNRIRWTIGIGCAIVSLAGCRDTPTTATGPQSAPLGPVSPDRVRYTLTVIAVDTVAQDSSTVLDVRLRVRTVAGLAVQAAEVDFGATEGAVEPTRTLMNPDGTVEVEWRIPRGTFVANLYGCARPIGQTCNTGPLYKWNQ